MTDRQHWKAGAAVVLLTLAVVTSGSGWSTVFLAAAVAFLVAASARLLTENWRLMRLTLPPWRRWLGLMAFLVLLPLLLFWVMLSILILSSGRTSVWLAVLVTMVLAIVGVRVLDWFWKPFREARDKIRGEAKSKRSGDPR